MRKFLLPILTLCVGFVGGCFAQKSRTEHADAPESIVINRPSGNTAEPRDWVTLRVLPAGGEPGPAAWFLKFMRGDETVKTLRCLPVTD